jgi:CO dehydrogenase/acetyl-CoA synthase beta subunit
MAVELGSPLVASVSCIIWTEDIQAIKDGLITLIGPDIPESNGKSLPFGKIVLAGISGFNEENTYDRHREMEMLRYSVDLKGYMMRAVSQYQREWSRISKQAVASGFSFETLGRALMEKFKQKDYVGAIELILVTSSSEDVKVLKKMTAEVSKIVSAMDKMAQEMSFDCDNCDYSDVCDEVDELKKMKRVLEQKAKEAK